MGADELPYRLRHGEPYVRASTVVGQLAKPGVEKAIARLTAEHAMATAKEWFFSDEPRDAVLDRLKGYVAEQWDAKAQRGTDAHTLVDAARDGNVPAEVPKDVAGHLKQWLQFVREWNVEVLASELVLFHDELRYTGRFDLLCTIPRFGLLIVDVKTGKSVWPEAALQLAGYRHATTLVWPDGSESDWQEIVADAGGAVLHLRPRSHGLHLARIDGEVFALFRHLLDLYYARPMLEGVLGPKLTTPDEVGMVEE